MSEESKQDRIASARYFNEVLKFLSVNIVVIKSANTSNDNNNDTIAVLLTVQLIQINLIGVIQFLDFSVLF
jgi:hypothetical protein